MSQIKVLLVDDHELLREGLRELLELDEAIVVVGSVGSAMGAVKAAESSGVEVALIDYQLPDRDGLWLLQQLKEHVPGITVIMLSMHSDETLIQRALQAGADGYLCKTSNPQQMIAAIKSAHHGAPCIDSPQIVGSLYRQHSASRGPERLSELERDVLTLVAGNRSNQEVAQQLGTSVPSIKNHLLAVFRKLDALTREEAIREAARRGEISLPTPN